MTNVLRGISARRVRHAGLLRASTPSFPGADGQGKVSQGLDARVAMAWAASVRGAWCVVAFGAALSLGCGGEATVAPSPGTGCYQGSGVSDAIAPPDSVEVKLSAEGTFPLYNRRIHVSWRDRSEDESCFRLKFTVRTSEVGPEYASDAVVLPAGATSYDLPVDFLSPLWVHVELYAATADARSAPAETVFDYPLYD